MRRKRIGRKRTRKEGRRKRRRRGEREWGEGTRKRKWLIEECVYLSLVALLPKFCFLFCFACFLHLLNLFLGRPWVFVCSIFTILFTGISSGATTVKCPTTSLMAISIQHGLRPSSMTRYLSTMQSDMRPTQIFNAVVGLSTKIILCAPHAQHCAQFMRTYWRPWLRWKLLWNCFRSLPASHFKVVLCGQVPIYDKCALKFLGQTGLHHASFPFFQKHCSLLLCIHHNH